MEDCNLCKKAVQPGTRYEDSHEECDEEWQRRIREGICTICGDNPAGNSKIDDNWCGKCGMDTPYSGYEDCYTGGSP